VNNNLIVAVFDTRRVASATRNTQNNSACSSDITLLGLVIDETSSLENVSNTDAIDVIAGNSSLDNISSHK
jgi:hypothetical protein